jgi:phospholipid/cholesterol/gamma-HCH transport system substrate-binding protein
VSWRSQRDRGRLRPELLGILVIVAVIAGFYLAATKHIPFTGGNQVRLEFTSANSITPNSPVRIAGVNVGKVDSIEAGPGDASTVVVNLDDDALPLHTDATARIRPRTFLEGAFFIDIRPGSPSAPELPNDGTVPLGQTSDPVQFDQVLTSLQQPVRESLKRDLIQLSVALSGQGPQAIRNTIPTLNPLLRNAAVVSEAATGTEPHDLSQAIASSSKVAAAVAADRPALGSVVSNFATVSAALASRQRQLSQTVAGLDRVMKESPATLDAVHAATPPARNLVAAARPLLRRAPGVINASIPLSFQLRKLLEPNQLPELVSQGAPTVTALAGAAPDTTVAFAGLRAPTTCLKDDAVPTLMKPVDDGSLSTGQPTYRELFYSLTGLASATRDFDGNGYATRYYAGFGDELLSTPFGSPTGNLFGLGDNPIVGSRPKKPSEAPPLRPDVPCTQNEMPDLTAENGPGGFTPKSGQINFQAPPGVRPDPKILREMVGGKK